MNTVAADIPAGLELEHWPECTVCFVSEYAAEFHLKW